MNISLIIPIKNDYEAFSQLMNAINDQVLLPDEIIIIDSSDNDKIKKISESHSLFNSIKYYKFNNKYPGEARNIGINKSNFDLVAFLDSKTIPNKEWLRNQKEELINNNLDVVFGRTKYFSKNKFQDFVKAATFGNISHVTTPGSIVKRNILLDNYFIEGVRTADDLEWRQRLISKNIKYSNIKNNFLSYYSLPNNLYLLLKRYFIYSFHTAQVNIDNKLKLFYFFILLLFLLFFIPRWNHYLPGWNTNHPLYIENHIKFFLLSFVSIVLMSVTVQNLPFLKKNKFYSLIKIIILFFLIVVVYNWNFSISDWIEKSVFYFPHITKIFILLVFFISFLVRGIYYPLKRKIHLKFLLPLNWIITGLIGFLIDLIKAPAYLYGSILPKFLLKKNNKYKNFSVIFYPKYANKSPSYRTRFLSYINFFNDNGVNVTTKELFDENFYDSRIFKKKTYFLKIFKFYYLRIFDLIFRKKPFIAITHIELLPHIPFLGEIILKLRKIPYIVDIDDAVYFRFKNKNKILFMIDKFKFNYMAANSAAILAGNQFHLNYFKQITDAVYYFPTTIDFKNYKISKFVKKHSTFTIVWIGTPSTTFYLQSITGALNKFKSVYNVNIKVIGADKSLISDLNCTHVVWSQKTEIEELLKSHLGIMPLLNSSWELGKCAYKILQYMSLKIPVIASPVGVNSDIITDNFNGLLATNNDEWFSKIYKLYQDNNFREKISNNGYETSKKHFNLDDYKYPYLNILKNKIKSIKKQ